MPTIRPLSTTGKPFSSSAVPGAGTGIGKGVALEFCREGADVVIHYSSSREGALAAVAQARDEGAKKVTALHADFRQADLTGADLSAANLTDASLTAVIWNNTTCPDGTNSDADGFRDLLHQFTVGIVNGVH